MGFQDQALPAAHEWGVGSRRGVPSAERSVAGKYREVDSGARAQRVLGFELTRPGASGAALQRGEAARTWGRAAGYTKQVQSGSSSCFRPAWPEKEALPQI